MNNLLEQLHKDFIESFNQAWRAAESDEFELNNYDALVGMLNDANALGYEFLFSRDYSRFVKQKIMHTDLEKEMTALPKWNEVEKINNMIEACKNQKMENLADAYEAYRTKQIHETLGSFVMQCANNYGPFFPGEQPDQIEVFGSTGNFQKDMMLIAIICAQSNCRHEKTKSTSN